MCDNWFENFKDAVQESKKLNNTGYLIDKSLTALTYKVLKNIDSWKDDDIYQTVKRDNQKVYYVVGIDGSIGLISNEEDGAGWFLTPPESSLEWSAVINLLKDDNKRLESQLKDQDEELERAINIINDLNERCDMYDDDFFDILCGIFDNNPKKVKKYYSKHYSNYNEYKDIIE